MIWRGALFAALLTAPFVMVLLFAHAKSAQQGTWCSGDVACLYDHGLRSRDLAPRDLAPGFEAVLVAT